MKELIGIQLGGSLGTSASYGMNASFDTRGFAASFLAVEPEIDHFWVTVQTAGGTDALRKMTFELQEDNNNTPSGVALQSYEKTGGMLSTTYVKVIPFWSGLNLTIGARYWIVFKNTSIAPTTDYANVTYAQSLLNTSIEAITYDTLGDMFSIRTWNGTIWTAAGAAAGYQGAVVVGPTKGMYGINLPHASGPITAYRTSTTRSSGLEIRLPKSTPRISITGARIRVYRQGTVSDARLYIYVNQILQGETYFTSKPHVNTSGSTSLTGAFSKKILAQGGDTVQIMVEPVGDGSSAASFTPYTRACPNDAAYLANIPFNYQLCKLESGVWTFNNTDIPAGALYLDAECPFPPAPLNRRKFQNQR